MDKTTAYEIRAMIFSELNRYDLIKICENWGLICDDFYDFVDAGLNAIVSNSDCETMKTE